jgi:hypothetical protein
VQATKQTQELVLQNLKKGREEQQRQQEAQQEDFMKILECSKEEQEGSLRQQQDILRDSIQDTQENMMRTLQKQQEDNRDNILKVQELRHLDMKEVVKEVKTQREEHKVQREEDRALARKIMSKLEKSRDEIRMIKTGLEKTNETLSNQDARISQVINEVRVWQKEQEELAEKCREEKKVAWREMQEEQERWMKDPLEFQRVKEKQLNHGVVRESNLTDSETVSVTRWHIREPTVRRDERVEDSRNENGSETQEDESRPSVHDGRMQELVSDE